MICEHCGKSRGSHMADGYYCPSGDGFHRTRKFRLKIDRMAGTTMQHLGYQEIEREAARRVLSQLEGMFDTLGSVRAFNRTDVLDMVNVVKGGYGLC